MDRKEFLKHLGFIAGSILMLPSCALKFDTTDSGYRVLDDDEAACLAAMCEQIIPADEDPGATDAGVVRFIDKQTAIRFPDDKKQIENGVASLQAYCREMFRSRFEALDFQTQTEIMKKMERGELPGRYWTDIAQDSFFNLVLVRTMQGFYGSPRHGGNKNYVSYRMMKLDYPLLVGQNRYRHGE